MEAKSEKKVGEILEDPYFKEGTWENLGGIRNYSIIANQQSNPVASLMEKITNAQDAILLRKCKEKDIIPTSDAAPASMKEATELFLRDLPTTKQAELIKIKVDGSKGEDKNLNVTIIDKGEGQSPEHFEDTFLSLVSEANKSKENIRFVQGRFDMGGTGVLRFCGNNGYELIISRSFLGGDWGWTLIRRNINDGRYEYFKHRTGIPSFNSEALKLPSSLVTKEKRKKGQVEKVIDGTIIKLYNYKLSTKSTITSALRNEIDLYMWETPLPITLEETRDVTGRDTELKSIVLDVQCYGNREKIEKHRDLLESDMPIVIDYNFGNKFGVRPIEMYVFKSKNELLEIHKSKLNARISELSTKILSMKKSGKDQTKVKTDLAKYEKRLAKLVSGKGDPKGYDAKISFNSKGKSIFLTINGQTHASLGKEFIKECKLPNLADDLVMQVDFSGTNMVDVYDTFMASRDRMSDGVGKDAILDGLRDCLKKDETLHELEKERLNKLMQKTAPNSDSVKRMFSNLFKRNPELQRILQKGNIPILPLQRDGGVAQLSVEEKAPKPHEPQQPSVPRQKEPYISPLFPTTFNIKGFSGEGIFEVELPINDIISVKFELNAPNDYFRRKDRPGELIIEPQDMFISKKPLNGTLTLRIQPTESAKEGDTQQVVVKVSTDKDEPLQQRFNVKYVAPLPEENYRTKKSTPDTADLFIGLPIPRLVKEFASDNFLGWNDMTPTWTDVNIVKVQENDAGLGVWINMDSKDIRGYVQRNKLINEHQIEHVENIYQFGIMLFSYASYSWLKDECYKSNSGADGYSEQKINLEQLESIIPTMMKGISATMLDLCITDVDLNRIKDIV